MNRLAAYVLIGSLLPGAALGDIGDGHTSQSIGRVFTSPAERAELDRLRNLRPAVEAAGAVVTTSALPEEDAPPEGTGYILRSKGAAYLWVDGDFRSIAPDDVERRAPLANIRIVRHDPPGADVRPATDAASERDDGEED